MDRVVRDGSTWRIGTEADVAWITSAYDHGRAIMFAIPPVFEAYATFMRPGEPGDGQDAHDQAVLGLLGQQSASQPWWLGYLDTGPDDLVFPDAPKATMYAGWHYVVVEAGPQQAATWRDPGGFFTGILPNLMFPGDCSWLVSALWDDYWTCIGGPAELVDNFVRHPVLQARPVVLD
jgi:hypothetical protein